MEEMEESLGFHCFLSKENGFHQEILSDEVLRFLDQWQKE